VAIIVGITGAPTHHLLDDTWLLAARAEKQFEALLAEIAQFFTNNPAELIVEDDAETGEKVVYWKEEPKPPREWGADVGQLVNNARTAMDHLIYALAIQAGQNPEADKTAFPIFESRDEYLKERGRGSRKVTVRDQYLAGVDEQWRKKVDAVQPFHRGKNAYLDPLAVLSDIANSHNHRMLKAAHVTIETPAHNAFTTSGLTSALVVRFDPTRSDHVSVEAKVHAAKSVTHPGIILQPKQVIGSTIHGGLVFGDPPRFCTLDQIRRAVQWTHSVLGWFEPAFATDSAAVGGT
jgi:hypothetical protein